MKCSTPVFQLKVLVNGKPIQEYHKDGNTFVEGRVNSNFELELKNLTCRKILVHPTVDGLSAMTGKEASMKDDEGYVLSPYQVMRVPGWRLNNQEIAQFVFAGSGQSYAEQTGKGKDKGVIACAVWEEEIKFFEPNWYHNSTSGIFTLDRGIRYGNSGGGTYSANTPVQDSVTNVDLNDSFSGESQTISTLSLDSCNLNLDHSNPVNVCNVDLCSSVSFGEQQKTSNNIGTGFGKKANHRVYTVTFNKSTSDPIVVATIYYDNIAGLKNRGIKISKKKQATSLPNPFPADKGCAPPPGWRG